MKLCINRNELSAATGCNAQDPAISDQIPANKTLEGVASEVHDTAFSLVGAQERTEQPIDLANFRHSAATRYHLSTPVRLLPQSPRHLVMAQVKKLEPRQELSPFILVHLRMRLLA